MVVIIDVVDKQMKKRKYLTATEIKELLVACHADRHGVRNRCIVNLMFIHGFRVSELCSLKVSDVDINGCTIHVGRLKNGFSTIHPITKKEELDSLKEWLLIRGCVPHGDGWLFLSQKGGRISRKSIYSIIKKLGVKARLTLSIHPHMLRHSCGFALAEQGVDTRLIQDYLGHRNINHTVIYTASNAKRFSRLWRSTEGR